MKSFLINAQVESGVAEQENDKNMQTLLQLLQKVSKFAFTIHDNTTSTAALGRELETSGSLHRKKTWLNA